MSEAHLILRMNLLNEFIEKDLKSSDAHLKDKIDHIFLELEKSNLNAEDWQTLVDLKNYYHQAKKRKAQNPMETLRTESLKRAFLKFRGLVFDLKTRFDYNSAEVAIQDGLDLSEYFREVIEEIHNDLADSLVLEIPELNQVRDELSQYYATFNRERLGELYPNISQTFATFRQVLDDLEIHVS